MDETPEQLEQIRREADEIDVHRYSKRFRAMKAIALGAFAAGVVSLGMWMLDSRRNPCERMRDYYCKQDAKSLSCTSYQGILDESLHDSSAQMRGNIKSQCLSKIERLESEDGIKVK
jgi:hypothetical protein